MTPVPVISVLWLLAMIAAIAFGAPRAGDPLERLWLIAAFVFGLMLTQWVVPSAHVVGVPLALAAGWGALGPLPNRASFVLSGVFAGLAAGLFTAQGAPLGVSILLSAGVLLAGLLWSRDERFASAGLRPTLFAMLACAALFVAAVPGVLDGWRSAQALNLTVEEPARIAVPIWTLGLIAAAALAGALRGLWGRR